VLISLAKFDKIHQVNLEHKWAIVGAGLVNAKLTEYLKSSSMHFAPDPSSQLACTLGGNVAENAGGIHCFKYGMTVDHTLGLEYIDAEGNINYLGNLGASDEYVPSSFNFDMTGFFVGSEGTLGIATKIMVKLSENPASCFTARICFVDPLEATRLVSEIIRSGLSPAALEIIDNYAVQAVNNSFKLGLATDIKSVLIIEFDGYKDEIVSEVEDLKQIIINFQVADYGETFDPNERLKLWKVRKGAAAAFGQIAPYWYLYDFVVPRSKISAALSEVQLIAAKYKLVLANLIHAGDGNLHPNFLYDPVKEPDVLDRIHQASHEIMQVCTKLDGALSGEHGIGIEKKEFMKFMFNDEDLKMMLKARRVFDPQFLANPYKVFPNHVCGECAREIKG
jgi:glycolate oxidase subunit GlcD